MRDHIQHAVARAVHPNTLSPKVLTGLTQAIYFVALGIRASCLLDYHLTAAQASTLIHALRKFSDSYTFIAHHDRLLDHYHRRYDTLYVDIQGTEPRKLAGAPSDVHAFITEELGPFLEAGASDWETSSVPCFMVTLAGWLLEYPVVYVSHEEGAGPLDEWEVRTNCLGQRPLICVQLQAIEHQQVTPRAFPLLSFTFPVSVVPDHDDQQRLIEHVRNVFSIRMTTPYTLQVERAPVIMDRIAL
ncbi:hypothetical protein BC940DRAFT_21406 [Gongronella butleri]|nr:hypothetical protein BC940DRAFT_21406 [Gongronella butleri]